MGSVMVAVAVCLRVKRNVSVMVAVAKPLYVRKTVIPSRIYLSVRSTANVTKEDVICHYVKRAVVVTEAIVLCQNVQKPAALRMGNLPWVPVKATVTTTTKCNKSVSFCSLLVSLKNLME